MKLLCTILYLNFGIQELTPVITPQFICYYVSQSSRNTRYASTIFFVQDRKVNESMAMILLNSSDLLRVDLKGVNVILPDLVLALEAVLGDQVDEY